MAGARMSPAHRRRHECCRHSTGGNRNRIGELGDLARGGGWCATGVWWPDVRDVRGGRFEHRDADDLGCASAKCCREATECVGLGFFFALFEVRDGFAAQAGKLGQLTDAQAAALARLTQATQFHGILLIEVDKCAEATLLLRSPG